MSRRKPPGRVGRLSQAERTSDPVRSLQPRSTRSLRAVLRLLPAVLILVVGIGAYADSFNGVFVLDEQTAIVDNPNIRSIRTSFSAPKEVGFAGRPVVSLSFALNYVLAPGDVRDVFTLPPGADAAAREALYRNLWGYHAANLGIHLLAALALFGILRRTLSRSGMPATPLALVVALLWVAHPLCTGSITYVAQRVESLMGLFFLLTLYCAIRAGEAVRWPQAAGGQTSVVEPASGPAEAVERRLRPPALETGLSWTAAAILFCALGMGTKEVMVAAPIIVFLYDLVFFAPVAIQPAPGAKTTARTLRAGVHTLLSVRLPLYAGFVGCWIVLAVLVLSNPRAASVGASHGWSSWLYLQTQAGVIVHYLRLALLPWPLVLDYEWPAAASLASVLPQVVFLAVLLALTIWGLLRLKPVALLGAWFFLILAPSSSILPIVTEIAAEHRMYLPLCAVIALVVVGGYRLLGGDGGAAAAGAATHASPSRWNARFSMAIVAAAIAIAGCAYLTAARNDDYSSYERIWADTVAKRPENARARSNYGTVLFEQGRASEAETQLRKAIEIREAYPEAQANLGAVLCSQGRLEEGIAHLRRAIALEPGYRDAYRNLGEALASLGMNVEALDAYRKALVSAPNDPRLLSRIAWLMATSPEDAVRDGRRALTLAERAVQITDGRDADSLDTLAAAYAEIGQFRDAARTEERAIAAAQSTGMAQMIPDMQARLEMYRAGQRFRQAPPQRG